MEPPPRADRRPPFRAAAQIGSDDATIDVDDLETLEPLAEAGGDDGEFSLSWLEEDRLAMTDSSGANGAPRPSGEKDGSRPRSCTAPAKKDAAAAKGNGCTPQGKAKPAADSDSLGDLDDLCN